MNKNSKKASIFTIIEFRSYEEYLEHINNTDVNIIEFNYSLLQTAIASKKTEIAKDLIKRGISVNHQDNKGASALHYAAAYDNLEIAELILKNGGDLSVSDQYGNQPLWTAVHNARLVKSPPEIKDDIMMIKLFCEHGADVDHKNNVYKSPLELAEDIGNPELISILNKHRK